MLLLLQTKVVSNPITSVSTSAPVPIPRFAAPLPATQPEASQESSRTTDATSTVAGDGTTGTSRAQESAKAGVAHSVTTDDGSVPDTSGPDRSAASQHAQHPPAKAQVSLLAPPSYAGASSLLGQCPLLVVL